MARARVMVNNIKGPLSILNHNRCHNLQPSVKAMLASTNVKPIKLVTSTMVRIFYPNPVNQMLFPTNQNLPSVATLYNGQLILSYVGFWGEIQ